MPKEKFVRRHVTEEEKDRLFRRGEEPTEAEKERAEKAKKMIEKLYRRAREASLARGGKEFDDKVYDGIDTSPEPCEEKSTNTIDDGR